MDKVVIIGGGMSGLASAYLLSKNGVKVTVIEESSQLGGLAASFLIKGKAIPRSYHHILSKDSNLVYMIKELGLYDKIKWKHIKFVFWINNRHYNLSNPKDLLLLPLKNKIKFVFFMLRCFLNKNWKISELDAKSWLDNNASKNIRETIFEPMSKIKFGVGTSDLSASWLQKRLYAREGSSLFGYMEGIDWAYILVKRLENEIIKNGGDIVTNIRADNILIKDNKVIGVKLKGKLIECNKVISTLPITQLKKIVPEVQLESPEYISTISCIVGTNQKIDDFYWMVCSKPLMSFGGIFQLSSLNPTLGFNMETVLNFFTNVDENSKLFGMSDDQIIELYKKDFNKVFKRDLNLNWYKLFRIKNSSPKFVKDYRNPPILTDIQGLYLSGAYKEYPMLTSTGTAIFSGIKTARKIMEEDKLSVVIGTYDEAKNIPLLISEITKTLKYNNIQYEIIVVDDNSPDGTAEVVKKLAKNDRNIRLIVRKNERGLATALLKGLSCARGLFIVQMDADLCHDPKHLPEMLKLIKQKKGDIVIGSRYMPNSKFLNKSLFKKLVSITAQMIANIVLKQKVNDTTNNYRMFKREVYDAIYTDLKSTGNVILLEFLHLADREGYKIKEIPIHYVERRFGKTKLRIMKESYYFIKAIFQMVFKNVSK